jgi:alkylhydroperoxidase family enzyme
MLGRSIGLTYEKLRHLPDDPLPEGVYSPAEAAVVRYAQRSTKGLAIDASTFRALAEHFSTPQIIDICLNVGLSQITNRFNATFLPDVMRPSRPRTKRHTRGREGPRSNIP